jgi:hypothetical protein
MGVEIKALETYGYVKDRIIKYFQLIAEVL